MSDTHHIKNVRWKSVLRRTVNNGDSQHVFKATGINYKLFLGFLNLSLLLSRSKPLIRRIVDQ
jgi:hypothetical protein